ncbi:unnamed protein product, partial [Phaeothamnion confervicola]
MRSGSSQQPKPKRKGSFFDSLVFSVTGLRGEEDGQSSAPQATEAPVTLKEKALASQRTETDDAASAATPSPSSTQRASLTKMSSVRARAAAFEATSAAGASVSPVRRPSPKMSAAAAAAQSSMPVTSGESCPAVKGDLERSPAGSVRERARMFGGKKADAPTGATSQRSFSPTPMPRPAAALAVPTSKAAAAPAPATTAAAEVSAVEEDALAKIRKPFETSPPFSMLLPSPATAVAATAAAAATESSEWPSARSWDSPPNSSVVVPVENSPEPTTSTMSPSPLPEVLTAFAAWAAASPSRLTAAGRDGAELPPPPSLAAADDVSSRQLPAAGER